MHSTALLDVYTTNATAARALLTNVTAARALLTNVTAARALLTNVTAARALLTNGTASVIKGHTRLFDRPPCIKWICWSCSVYVLL
jgi:hypothetical protein